jgi:hypothetical protein
MKNNMKELSLYGVRFYKEKYNRWYIDLPEWNNFDFTINNCCIFISDTFITPASYVINNNTFTFTNGYTMNTGEMMVICVLKMVNEFEDPTTPRGSVIYNQLLHNVLKCRMLL